MKKNVKLIPISTAKDISDALKPFELHIKIVGLGDFSEALDEIRDNFKMNDGYCGRAQLEWCDYVYEVKRSEHHFKGLPSLKE